MREYLYVLIIAAAVTYLLTPLVRRFAVAINAQHEPRSRDTHTTPTPLLGGLAMYGGLAVALLVADRLSYLQRAFPSSRTVGGLLLAAGLLVLVGMADDKWEIGPLAKLAGQIAAGGIVAWSGAILAWPLLLRRVGSLDGWRITRSLVRMLLATVPGLLFALVAMAVMGSFMHQGAVYGFIATVVGGGGALVLYAICARLLGIEEFRTLMRTVGGRFG